MRRGRVLAGVAAVVLVAAGGWCARLAMGAGSPVLRTVPLNGSPAAMAVDGRKRRVLVISGYSGGSALLDAPSGAVLRTLPVVGAAVAVDERSGHAFVTGPNGVSILDTASGRLVRAIPMSVAPDTLAADPASGHVFVANPGSDTVTMLDAASGALLHTTGLVMMPQALLGDAHDGLVYVTNGTPLVAVLDARSGALVRTVVIRDLPNPAAVDGATGRIAVADPGVSMVSLIARGGSSIIRTMRVPAAPLAIWTDALTGRVFVLARSGASLTLSRTPAPILQRGWLLSAGPMATGAIYVFDGRSGALLQALPAGVAPAAAVLDVQDGYLFVANGFGVEVTRDPWSWMPWWLRRRLPFLPPPGLHIHVIPPHVTVLAAPR